MMGYVRFGYSIHSPMKHGIKKHNRNDEPPKLGQNSSLFSLQSDDQNW